MSINGRDDCCSPVRGNLPGARQPCAPGFLRRVQVLEHIKVVARDGDRGW